MLAKGVMYKIRETDEGLPKRRRFAFGAFSAVAAGLALFFILQNTPAQKDFTPQPTTALSEEAIADAAVEGDGETSFGLADSATGGYVDPAGDSSVWESAEKAYRTDNALEDENVFEPAASSEDYGTHQDPPATRPDNQKAPESTPDTQSGDSVRDADEAPANLPNPPGQAPIGEVVLPRVIRLPSATVPASLADYTLTDCGDHAEILVPMDDFAELWADLQADGAQSVTDAALPTTDMVLIILPLEH